MFMVLLLGTVALALWHDKQTGRELRLDIAPWEICILALIVVALIFYYLHGLDSWKFAFIGDEYGFFWFAERLIPRSWSESYLLEASGCFEFFPMFTSWWQACFMRFFGATNVSWRASMVVITALSAPAFYLFLKGAFAKLGDKAWGPALAGTFALYLSEFTVVWARIGKPHAVFLTPVVFAAAFMMRAMNEAALTFLVLAGFSAGLGMFMSSLGPVIAFGTCIIILVVWRWPLSGQYRRSWLQQFVAPSLIVGGTFVISAGPILVQRDYWSNMLFVNLASQEAMSNLHLFIPKLVASTFLPLYFKTSAHFLSGNVVDPLSAALCIAGFAGVLYVGWRPVLVAILIHGMIAYLVGAKSQYPYPPPTRMQLAMFPIAIMTGAGFASIPWRKARHTAAALLCLIAWIGSYSWVKLENYNPYQARLHPYMAFLKTMQEFPLPGKKFVLVLPHDVHPYILVHLNKTYNKTFPLFFVDAGADPIPIVRDTMKNAPGQVVVLLPDTLQHLRSKIESSQEGPVDVSLVNISTPATRNEPLSSYLTGAFLPIIEFFEGTGGTEL
jgi:hypothetical protein